MSHLDILASKGSFVLQNYGLKDFLFTVTSSSDKPYNFIITKDELNNLLDVAIEASVKVDKCQAG